MPKLTDTQLVILSAAAGRDDHAVLPLPKSLKIKGGAVATVLKSLIKRDLVAEKPARRDNEMWREVDDKRMTLVITSAGLNAIGAEPEKPSEASAASTRSKPKRRRARTSKSPDGKSSPSATSGVRPGTKQALLIDLFNRKNGATIAEAVAMTGWQRHSVRGAISGTLKKKLGLAVTSTTVDGRGRVHQIVRRL